MTGSAKLSITAAVIYVAAWPGVTSASNFRLVPEARFEHRSYESGGEDYLARPDGNEIVYQPENRALFINRHKIDLSGSTYASLDEADFSEAAFYTSRTQKSRLCIEFGFGGLSRSGSFQQIKGALIVQAGGRAPHVIRYQTGPRARCKNAGVLRPASTAERP